MAGLEFDVRPGSGVSKFDIGLSLWTVLEQLRAYRLTFPTVDIKFDPESSATSPVILHVRPHLDLLFSGLQQRLHTICIRRLRDELHPPLTLRYKDRILCSSTEVLRRVDVSRTFGPTYVGDELQYPGIWFTFDDDGRTEPRPIGKHVPLSHGKDRDQEVRRIIISEKDFNRDTRDALDEVKECSTMNGDVRRAVVRVHEGVTLHMYPTTAAPVSIELGTTTVQDLILDLGRPAQVFYKTDERMNIHSESSSGPETEADYFYNYFQYGIDCLISGTEHIVKKLVLHTNVPGTPMFQRYKRCPWEIEGKPEDDEDDSPPRMKFYDAPEAIGHFLNPKEEPTAMVFDRTDDENGVMLSNSGSQLQAYDGIILEVADAGQVTSVTLF